MNIKKGDRVLWNNREYKVIAVSRRTAGITIESDGARFNVYQYEVKRLPSEDETMDALNGGGDSSIGQFDCSK